VWSTSIVSDRLSYSGLVVFKGVDPMCFSGSGPNHFFTSWVRIGIGPTHFLRWIVYYCVCIQHDIDKSQISFIELCFSKHCFVTAEFKISISPADCRVWTHPHFYTDLLPWLFTKTLQEKVQNDNNETGVITTSQGWKALTVHCAMCNILILAGVLLKPFALVFYINKINK